MPKKRNIKYTKPSSSAHPSLSSKKENANHLRSGSGSEANSVNDRIQRLRLQQSSSPGAKPFEAPPSHTVHPSLQAILQVPDAPPPRPRPGLRVAGGRRGPAGPPPPGSWLERRSKEKGTVKSISAHARTSPILPGYDLPASGSLLDTTLKQLALHWSFHVQYDQYYLATIPVRYKELLLHYIARHNASAVDRTGLETLFWDETELEGATGSVDLARLDLSASMGLSLSLKDLKSFFMPPNPPAPTQPSSTSAPAATDTDMYTLSSVPDSWDTPTLPPQLHQTLTSLSSVLSPHFATLTHLSLASPPPNISWSGLLNHLVPHLPANTLTHLSLAFWPHPTLTPNSLTAIVVPESSQMPLQAGGTHYYSAYDGDWSEPASIMRRVARATPGLQWLDLTGDWPWMQALKDEGFDWSGLWSLLETIVVGQGWVPDCFSCSSSSPSLNHGDPSISMPWREIYSFAPRPASSTTISQYSLHTAFAHREAYTKMTSTLSGLELLTWARDEYASLEFEKVVRARVREGMTVRRSDDDQHVEEEEEEEEEGEEDWGRDEGHSAFIEYDEWSSNRTRSSRGDGDSRRALLPSKSKAKSRKNSHTMLPMITLPRRKRIRFERGWDALWIHAALEEIRRMERQIRREV